VTAKLKNPIAQKVNVTQKLLKLKRPNLFWLDLGELADALITFSNIL
jgi:hypothetical protein